MAGLAALVLLAYVNSFDAGFVLDNRVIVLEDPRLRGVGAENLRLIATRGYWWPYADLGLYRPFTTLSYLLNYTVLGHADRPAGYHAGNLALHLANVLVLCALVRRLTASFWTAVIAAAIVAVHPINTEAVTNIVGRADLLAALGVLGALYAHLRAMDQREPHPVAWRVVEALGVSVGVFSKESAVAVVGVIVLFDLVSGVKGSRRLGFVAWLPALIPAAVFLVARAGVLDAMENPIAFPYVDNPLLGASFWTGRLTALAVAGRYLWLLIWPARLSADYSYAQIPLASGAVVEWLAWATVAAFIAAAAWLWSRQRIAFLALAAAGIMFLPVSNLVVTSGTIMAERLLYLPLMFLAPVAAATLFAIARFRTSAPVVIGVWALLIVAMGIRTSARNRDWHDDLSIWSATVESAPRSFKSHSGLANALHDADATRADLKRVVDEKDASLAILATVPNPAETSMPYYEAGVYYTEYGDQLRSADGAGALRAYERAAQYIERYLTLATPSDTDEAQLTRARLLQSTLYTNLSRGGQAVELARAAVGREPLNAVAYRALANALVSASRADEAASSLLTGFMLTGDPSLRQGVVDLYRAGLDTEGCAVTNTGTGVTLNRTCAVVVRHLCGAATAAAAVHRQAGRADLADQALAATAGITCGP